MKYSLIKKTPSGRKTVIRNGLDLDVARYVLVDICKSYEFDEPGDYDNILSDDGMSLASYDGGDRIEYNIIEMGE